MIVLPFDSQSLFRLPIPFLMADAATATQSFLPLCKVGIWSGYNQSVILSQLVGKVYSVERIKPLQERAAKRLSALQINNVHLEHTDGGFGLAKLAPFDAILVTAAADAVPQDLLDQLVINGAMVIPVGDSKNQQLKLIIKKSAHCCETQIIEAVNFVPLLAGVVSS